MHQIVQTRALSMQATSIIIGGSLFVTPLSNAQALSFDGIVDSVRNSSTLAFGLGCAVGAVVGGLAIGLYGRHARKKLKEELEELVGIAERAEAAVRRAEAILDGAQNEEKDSESTDEQRPTQKEFADSAAEEKMEFQKTVESESQDVPEATGVLDRTPITVTEVNMETTNLVGRPVPQVSKREAKDAGTEQRQPNRGVRSILQSRLGSTNAFLDMPVIDRGQTRAMEEDIFSANLRPRRQFNPVARAEIIDRRVPRFDESLFPDTVSEQHTVDDMFESAMRAMDDSLTTNDVLSAPQQMLDSTSSLEVPAPTDTKSYVEYLVKDEIERNRSKQARRFSRAHLTMIEGTGDLSAARKAASNKYRPRHMQVASKDA